MILVHDAAREKAFLEEGYGVNRKIVAYNFFVIVGPEDDPANIQGLDPVEALLTIKAAGEAGDAVWVSRGDDSGTHAMEKRLWIAGGEDVAELREDRLVLRTRSRHDCDIVISERKESIHNM